MEEIWKKIPGIPEAYEVSSLGNVRTWYPPHNSHGRLMPEPSLKKVTVGRKGYRQVTLTIPGKRKKHFRVSHLVLMAFEGPRPEGYEASHVYGNKLIDEPWNLLWETGDDNRAREEVGAWNRSPKKPSKLKKAKKKSVWRERYKQNKGLYPRGVERLNSGLCIRCGIKRNLYSRLCDACYAARMSRVRPPKWKPGSRGPVPKAFMEFVNEAMKETLD